MRKAARLATACAPLLALLLFAAGNAQAAEYRGAHTLTYKGLLDGAEKQQAEALALQNAVERWIAEKNPSHYKNYERIKAGINSDVKAYLLDYRSTEELDRKNNSYRVTVLVNINEPKLLNRLIESPGAPQTKKYIAFVFVAREQVGKVKAGEKSSTLSKAKVETIERGTTGQAAGLSKETSQTIGQRDRQESRQNQILWDAATTNAIDAAMGKVFTEADLLVVDAAYLERETDGMLKVDRFVKDYSLGADLTASTRSDALIGLSTLKNPVQYLAIGTLDIDEITTDPSTGNVKIAVSVTGQILSILDRGAVVAKVGPETSFGEGNTPFVARSNALSHAAEAVAAQLVAQLSAKGIR